MDRLTELSGIAAPLMHEAINTDVIFPARFLLITERRGLGRYLFHDLRRDREGRLTGDFVLDRPEFLGASILITGPAFGCGSSREQAVWTLLDAGLRCVISPSFGDIFYANCFQNGVLPITLDADLVAECAESAALGAQFHVDLVGREVTVRGCRPMGFSIPEDGRQALLHGRDATDQVLLGAAEAIGTFETAQRRRQPWLWE